jgi:hypothetical protein
VVGGTTFGASDKNAAYPLTTPVSPEDLAATLYCALGIDPSTRLAAPEGGPVEIVQNGVPIEGIFG